MILVRPKSSAHWYASDGTPRHTVIGSKGVERATTLRDARQLNLFPSVTSVLGVLAKPGLEAWKQEQAILAAITLPRIAGEGDDAFAARVVRDMDAQVERACDFGTRIHLAIESANAGAPELAAPEVAPWLTHYETWRTANILRIVSAEQSVICDGYAGRFDMLADHQEHGLCLVDFKTQNVKKGKPTFYETWCWQLAAYRRALGVKCQCLSLVIDSNTPGAPVEKLWSEDELMDGLEIFTAAVRIWQKQRGYVPELSPFHANTTAAAVA